MKLWSSGGARAQKDRASRPEWTPEEPAEYLQPMRELTDDAQQEDAYEEQDAQPRLRVLKQNREPAADAYEEYIPYGQTPEPEAPEEEEDVYDTAQDRWEDRGVNTLPSWVGRTQKRRRRWPLRLLGAALALIAVYSVAVFSTIPFVAKWRAIYIETAMGTMTHQWLATAFIPRPIIEAVMYERWMLEQQQPDIESDPSMVTPVVTTRIGTLRPADQTSTAPAATSAASTAATSTAATEPEPSPWEDPNHPVYLAFPELDQKSFAAYAMAHEAELFDADGYLVVDCADPDAQSTGILTVQGDPVLAVDTRNGILIARVTGEGYVGRLAIVHNPAQVGVAPAPALGDTGAILSTIAKRNDAVLGINASGFEDPEGHGNGGTAYGLVLAGGVLRQGAIGGDYKTIGFDGENRLLITGYKKSLGLRDAVEFKPALVVDGKKKVSGSAGWGIQPRTAIGQTADGEVLMLVVDGRQIHSLGCTVGDLADIMLRYGAVQACNLDGGSSSVMFYNGREVSQPSAADKKQGRRLPDAFLVYSAG